jgi:hypothetical protein
MRIYFTASVSGKEKYGENYEKIVKALADLDHKVVADHILKATPEKLKKETLKDRVTHHRRLNKWLNSCDVVVAEVSYPSVSVGYELTLALDKGKPVLALHLPEKVPAALLGESSDKFIMKAYQFSDLKRRLSRWLKELSNKIDVRFNFFITPQLLSYLDWIAGKKRIPRSVYLRNLIEKDMKKNIEYQKELTDSEESDN